MKRVLPVAMQVVLGLFLFSVLFTTGVSLKCETCIGYGKNCTGPWQKCDVGQDTCLIFLSEVTVGILKTPTLVKGCSVSEGCDTGPIHMAFGQGISMRANAVCCKGDACRSAFPHLASVNGKPNGLQCPACYSLTDTCPEEMVPCTGSEDTCFYTVLHRHDGDVAIQTTLKGCTTELMCARFKTGTLTFGGLQAVFTRVECRQAKRALP